MCVNETQEVMKILKETGALIQESHFVYTSGRHGGDYLNKDKIYAHPEQIVRLCWFLALRFVNTKVDVVVGPAMGGIILSQLVALHILRLASHPIVSIYAEKDGNGFAIRRGYDKHVPGKRVLVVEDILTTGGSAKKVVEAVRALGGRVIGLAALCNRGGVRKEDINVPRLETLVDLSLPSWAEADCPLCRDGVPVNTEVGKGKDWLARNADGI